MKAGLFLSVFLLLSGCSKLKNTPSPLNKKTSLLVGVQTNLMSFDPLSVNALGETLVLGLINKNFISVKEEKFYSEYFHVDYKHPFLVFDAKSKKYGIDIVKESFLNVKNSSLWKESFKKFIFDEDKNAIHCKQKKNCISKFISLVGLLRSKALSEYKTVQHKKGISLILKHKKNSNTILFIKLKSIEDGTKLLKSKKLDLVVPTEIIKSHPKELEFIAYKKKRKVKRLSVYKKFKKGLPEQFIKALCENQNSIDKVMRGWERERIVCLNKRNIIRKNKKINVIGNTKNTIKVFDIIDPFMNSKLEYEVLKPIPLLNKIKKSQFDLYVSEEVYSSKYPLLYSAFHSHGKHNTLGISDKKLDKLLEKAALSQSLKEYYGYISQSKKRLDSIEPVVLRYRHRLIKFIMSKKRNWSADKKSSFKDLKIEL